MKEIKLTVLSNGGGQDSTYLIHRLITDEEFYKDHVKGDFVIVGSNTGDEHDHTYKHIEELKKLCAAFGVEFHFLNASDGYHSESWKSLTYQYKKNSNVGSAAFRQTCTDNLKVKVVDRFVEKWINDKYFPGQAFSKKKVYHKFYEEYGSIRLILGFAYGEEVRTNNGNKFDPAWKKKTVIRHFPLILDGIDRQRAIDYNSRAFPYPVFPSNCMRCFYQSDQEILWLHRFFPDKFKEWQEMEQAKLDKYAHQEKNLGVYGKMTLDKKLERAIERHGHMADAELNEYKFSHGHCIKSKY